jgi:hypothetical protein
MVTVGRRYASLVLIILVASTAATYTIWLMRTGDPVELLVLEAPESLFASVQTPRTVSIAVSPQRDLDYLEFRFRCLLERPLPPALEDLAPGAGTAELLEACPAVRTRLEYFSSIGAEEFIAIREVRPSGEDGAFIVLADFANLFSSILEGDRSNQTYTTYAIMLNGTRHPEAYFEGYAELFTAPGHLLELVRVESGGMAAEYHATPRAGQPSIAELETRYGAVGFEGPRRGEVDGVTLVLKKRKTGIPGDVYEVKVAAPSYLQVVETYVDGKYVEKASGYWRIFHGDAPEEG